MALLGFMRRYTYGKFLFQGTGSEGLYKHDISINAGAIAVLDENLTATGKFISYKSRSLPSSFFTRSEIFNHFFILPFLLPNGGIASKQKIKKKKIL